MKTFFCSFDSLSPTITDFHICTVALELTLPPSISPLLRVRFLWCLFFLISLLCDIVSHHVPNIPYIPSINLILLHLAYCVLLLLLNVSVYVWMCMFLRVTHVHSARICHDWVRFVWGSNIIVVAAVDVVVLNWFFPFRSRFSALHWFTAVYVLLPFSNCKEIECEIVCCTCFVGLLFLFVIRLRSIPYEIFIRIVYIWKWTFACTNER